MTTNNIKAMGETFKLFLQIPEGCGDKKKYINLTSSQEIKISEDKGQTTMRILSSKIHSFVSQLQRPSSKEDRKHLSNVKKGLIQILSSYQSKKRDLIGRIIHFVHDRMFKISKKLEADINKLKDLTEIKVSSDVAVRTLVNGKQNTDVRSLESTRNVIDREKDTTGHTSRNPGRKTVVIEGEAIKIAGPVQEDAYKAYLKKLPKSKPDWLVSFANLKEKEVLTSDDIVEAFSGLLVELPEQFRLEAPLVLADTLRFYEEKIQQSDIKRVCQQGIAAHVIDDLKEIAVSELSEEEKDVINELKSDEKGIANHFRLRFMQLGPDKNLAHHFSEFEGKIRAAINSRECQEALQRYFEGFIAYRDSKKE